MTKSPSTGLLWALAVPQTRHLSFNKQTTSQKNSTQKVLSPPAFMAFPHLRGFRHPSTGRWQ